MAEPLLSTIKDPKNNRKMVRGSSQYFLRALMKPHKSRRKFMQISCKTDGNPVETPGGVSRRL
jgi:hypothetical protein